LSALLVGKASRQLLYSLHSLFALTASSQQVPLLLAHSRCPYC